MPTGRLVYGGRERASMAFVDELERYGDRVTMAPQDETGLLDLADSARRPPSRTRSSTAAAPRGCSPPSRSSARLAARRPAPRAVLRKAAGGGRRRRRRVRARPGALRPDPAPCRRTSRCSRWSTKPASAYWARASRASAVPARRRWSTATSTTATPCSTRRSRRVERAHDDLRLALPVRPPDAGSLEDRPDSAVGEVLGEGRRWPPRVTRADYPTNAWYVLATSDEVGSRPLGAACRRRPGRALPDRGRHGGRARGPLRAPAVPAEPRPGRGRRDRVRVHRLRLRPGRSLHPRAHAGRRCRSVPGCAPSPSTTTGPSSGCGSVMRHSRACARRHALRGCATSSGPPSAGPSTPPRTSCCCTRTSPTSPTSPSSIPYITPPVLRGTPPPLEIEVSETTRVVLAELQPGPAGRLARRRCWSSGRTPRTRNGRAAGSSPPASG